MCYRVPGIEACYKSLHIAVAAAIARKSYVLEAVWCTHGEDLTTKKKEIIQQARSQEQRGIPI